jgi:hypothetical protein
VQLRTDDITTEATTPSHSGTALLLESQKAETYAFWLVILIP